MDTWRGAIEVKREAEEAASNILIELGSQGVAVLTAPRLSETQVDQYGDFFQKLKGRANRSRWATTLIQ